MSARRATSLLLVPVVLVTAVGEASGAVRVRATVDRTQAAVGDRLLLTITVEGTQSAVPVDLPPLPAFDVMSIGTSSSVQIVNGQMSASVGHRYILVPKRAGTFTIGSATVQVGGQQHKSKPLSVKILPASSAAPPSRGPAQPSQPQPLHGQPRLPDKSQLFVTASVSRKDPFVSEGIVYTFRLYRRVGIGDAGLELPDFDGFVAEDLGKQKNYQTTVGGVGYLVTEINKVLFPQRAGEVTIPPAKLRCQVQVRVQRQRRRYRSPLDEFFESPFDDFFGRTRLVSKVLQTKPVTVSVKKLPPAPKEFSGLVGRFQLEGGLSRDRLHVGESTTLSLTVRGTGNVGTIPEPLLGSLEGFKVYADNPTGKTRTSGRAVSGYRTFKKALVPLKQGKVVLEGARLTYFDPKRKQYVVAKTEPFQMIVLQATGKEELRLTELSTASGGKVAVKLLGQDLLPPHKGLDVLDDHGTEFITLSLGLGGLFFPPVFFVGLVIALRQRERLEHDVALRRRRGALATARRRMRELKKALRSDDERKAAEAASRILREYLGDMLNLGGGALTGTEAGAQLRKRGMAEDQAKEVEELLVTLEQRLYGTETREARDLRDLDRKLWRLLHKLQRDLRKAARSG